MGQEIAYRFAWSGGQVVDIQQVTADTRAEDYVCIGCRARMVAKLGAKRVKHFAHWQAVSSCGIETYLHRLAKLVFCETYRACLAQNRPFIFPLRFPYRCTYLDGVMAPLCKGERCKEMDLTKWFSQCDLEVDVESWRPDILLRSVDGYRDLWIEIHVTHEVAAQKAASKHRIIELTITSELDIDRLRSSHIDPEAPWVRLYNFTPQEETATCEGSCSTRGTFFVVYASGKAFMKTGSPSEMRSIAANETIVYQLDLSAYGHSSPQLFVHGLKMAMAHDIPVRNCQLCQHYRLRWDEAQGKVTTYCRKGHPLDNGNRAASCGQWRAFGSVDDYADNVGIRDRVARSLGRKYRERY